LSFASKKINGSLDQLEAEAKSLKGKLTLGTISVICALGYLDFRFASRDWRGKHPKLAKWFATASKGSSIKATVPASASGRVRRVDIFARCSAPSMLNGLPRI
jgi:glutathione S-transferase